MQEVCNHKQPKVATFSHHRSTLANVCISLPSHTHKQIYTDVYICMNIISVLSLTLLQDRRKPLLLRFHKQPAHCFVIIAYIALQIVKRE